MGWMRGLVVGVLACGAVAAPAGAAAPSVVAVVGEQGVEVLHEQFRTADGRDAALPEAARGAVAVALPDAALPYEDRVAALQAGPLGRLEPGTLYYLRGTRLLLRTGSPVRADAVLAGPDAFHGTGVASLAAGRTTGTAPDALVVVLLAGTELDWDLAASLPWIDVVTSSSFDVVGSAAPVVCTGANAAAALRRSGRLPFHIAGNSAFATATLSPGHSPDVLRVGGVDGTGAPYVAPDGTNASAPLPDVAEAWSNRVAAAGSDDGLTTAGGTSGSTPRVAGRAAALIAAVRERLGHRGTGGADGGVLARAASGTPVPATGPLADGALTGEEVRAALLATSRPSRSDAGTRVLVEGLGWFDRRAQDDALAVLLGEAIAPSRPEDREAHDRLLAARTAVTQAKGCGLGAPGTG